MTRELHDGSGPSLVTARWIVGHRNGGHTLVENGELVWQDDRILFVGHTYPGEVARRFDLGERLVGPGFIDLDALGDLDTGLLTFDNGPGWRKGRMWPRSYMLRGPYEMCTPAELAFQKHYAFAQLIRNGITTALPIASLFYREWGETAQEFEAAADAALALGLRMYLGPAYRAGNPVVEADGTITLAFDEARGEAGLDVALEFCRTQEGRGGGLIRTMLAPDRIETATAALIRRSADAAREMGVPMRLHCCQGAFEMETMLRRFGQTAPAWLAEIGAMGPHLLLPHGTHVRDGDLDRIRDGGAALVHCPLVMARHGTALRSFSQLRAAGMPIGLGTDTWPADMLANMQLGVLLDRVVRGDASGVQARDYYDAATLGGADALGRPDLGRLAPGAKADFIAIDLGSDRVGLHIDPIQTLLLGASGRDVTDVIIDGRVVMSDGTIPGVDWTALHIQAQAQFERLLTKYPERTWEHPELEQIFPSSYPTIRE